MGRKKKIAAQIDRLTAETNSVTRHRVLEVAEVLARVQGTANDALGLANRAVNETKALVKKHELHDLEVIRANKRLDTVNEALAALNKEQEVQRYAHGLLDVALGRALDDITELRADVVRLSDLVAPLNEEVVLLRRYMGARIEGDKYGPVITAEQAAAALRTEPQAGDVVFYTPDGERYGPPNPSTITYNPDALDQGLDADPADALRETDGPRCDQWYTYGLLGQRTRCTLTLGHLAHHWYMRSRPTDAPPLTRPVLGPAGDTNVATLEGDDEPDATVTSIFHGGVDIPIPTYTTPSEVCAPPSTDDLDPIQVRLGSAGPETHFDWDDAKRAFINILSRDEWRRDEGAFEYDTTSDGYRITITHKNGETLTDMDIHGTLWKIIGGWRG